MKELTLEITNKCQLECPWCSSSSGTWGINTPSTQLKEVINRLKEKCSVIRLSGGEPTLHPDLDQIIDWCRGEGRKIELLTNGQILYFNPRVDWYIVNIVNPKSVRTTLTLLDKGYGVSTHVVATKTNGPNLFRALNLMEEESVPLRILKLQIQGRGIGCSPMRYLSWSGDKGCNKYEKITYTPEGNEVTCSALKYGTCFLQNHISKDETERNFIR